MDISSLKEAGLTEGEIKVYLALLELGDSTTGPIIEKSKVAKSIVYQILDKLIEKGLVSYIIKEKTKHFQAANPKRILDYIEERKKQLEKNKEKVENLIPKILTFQNKPISEAKLYEGFKGTITVHENTYLKLKEGEEYFYMGIPPEQPDYFHAYWLKDSKRRVKAGIKCKLLYNKGTSKEILKGRNKLKDCEARYMPLDIDSPAWFMGYKDVAIISFPSKNPITIEITNKEIADSFRSYFEEFWKKSKPFK